MTQDKIREKFKENEEESRGKWKEIKRGKEKHQGKMKKNQE